MTYDKLIKYASVNKDETFIFFYLTLPEFSFSRWLSFVFLSAELSQSRWAVYQNGKLEILLDYIGGLPNSHLFSLFCLSRTLIFFKDGIGLCSRKKSPFPSPGMSIDLIWS